MLKSTFVGFSGITFTVKLRTKNSKKCCRKLTTTYYDDEEEFVSVASHLDNDDNII